MQLLLAVIAFAFNTYLYPDARRVAPISACVSSSAQRYHSTLPLMGATRLASENMQLLLAVVAFVFNSYLYPDARRVAPISACVWW